MSITMTLLKHLSLYQHDNCPYKHKNKDTNLLKLELLVGLVVMLEEFWYVQRVVVLVGTLHWRFESLTFVFGVDFGFCV